MDILKFTAIVVIFFNAVFAQQSIQSECPSVFEFVNKTNDRWYGALNLKSVSQVQGLQIEIVFDEAVTILVNDFGPSRATDNRVFTIENYEKVLEAGEKIEVLFFVKFAKNSKIPRIKTIHLNGFRVCPDNKTDDDRKCIRIDTTSTTVGRWDGTLTVYSKFSQIGLKVLIELDGEAFVIGNDFGHVRTWNSRKFIILSNRTVIRDERIKIKFFVKYSEVEQIPAIESISIDDLVYCVIDVSNELIPAIPPMSLNKTVTPPTTVIDNVVLLSELPVALYPAVERIPTEVNNNDFACGSFNLISNRVQEGAMSERGQFPFHAAVYIKSVYQCGGSILSEKVIVTAAHCMTVGTTVLEKEDFRIVLGLTDLRNLTGVEAIRKVSEVIKHPDYNISEKVLVNDIGLLILSSKVQFTSFISPICLFDSFTPIDDQVGKTGLVLGWGLNSKNEISQHLNHGSMTFSTHRACTISNLLFGLLLDGTFCANALKLKQTVCSGDSGGGMVLLDNGKYYLRGLVSISIIESGKTCDVKHSVAFTDVSFYLKWLWDNMKIVTDLDERIVN